MKDFPRWVLVMAFANIIPVLLSVFFLFGGISPLGSSENSFLNFLLYLASNLLWLLPPLTFFLGLDVYRKGWEILGVAILAVGNLLTLIDILILILR